MPGLGIGLDRLLGDGQDDHRHAGPGGVELADQRRALDPALEQRVDDDHVGSELGDLARDLRAVGHDVEQLDLLLRVEQAPDVLPDLRDVLDDEQADLIGGGHRADYTKPRSRPIGPYPEVMGRPAERGRRGRPGRTVASSGSGTVSVAVDLARLGRARRRSGSVARGPGRPPPRGSRRARSGRAARARRGPRPRGCATRRTRRSSSPSSGTIGSRGRTRPGDELAGVGDERDRGLELEPLVVDLDRVPQRRRARRAARARRPSTRACRADACAGRRSPP